MGKTLQDASFVRKEIEFLEDLVTLRKRVHELKKRNDGYTDWDEEEPLMYLTRAHVSTVLQKFLNQELSEKDVHWWADTILYRATLHYEKGYNDVIASIILQIDANGELGEAINRQEAEEYIQQLTVAQFDPADD